MASEFNIITQYFSRKTKHTQLGIGDDAALLQISPGHQLAVSADMSVVGTHFFANAAPYDIGWKSLAVNVSDMAAMGANPKWATLAIAMPAVDEVWLGEFTRGFFDCADAFDVDLIGGDTTRGPLNISVQIMGEVAAGNAITRSAAKVGDDVWVSGMLGSAALGLYQLQNRINLDNNEATLCLNALNRPKPRLALGLALVGIAHSCIDVSDGLISDLGHLLKASNVGAEINIKDIPCIDRIQSNFTQLDIMQKALLAGGDDYELCFTAPSAFRDKIKAISHSLDLPIACIGHITASSQVELRLNQVAFDYKKRGYDHFA